MVYVACLTYKCDPHIKNVTGYMEIALCQLLNDASSMLSFLGLA